MKLTELALKNKVTTYLIFIILIFAGYYSYKNSEKAQDPGFTIKVALVTTKWPGATSKQMADLVTKKIVDQVQSMDSLDYTNSKNVDGESNVYINIKPQYRNLEPIWTELRDKINTFVVPSLPTGVGKPMINTYFGDVYGSLLSVSGKGYSYDELYNISEDLKQNILFSVPQVGKIDISGVQTKAIYIDINNKKLALSGVSLDKIIISLKKTNVISKTGTIASNSSRLQLKITGNYKNIKDIENTIISSADGSQSFYLKDIGTVRMGHVDPPKFENRYNGNKSITLALGLNSGSDILAMSKKLKDTVNKFKKTIPVGINIGNVYYQPDLVDASVTAFVVNLFQAIVIIVLVMLIFLGVRSGIIVAALTPTSIALAVIGIYIFDLGMNQITLAALIIALGMLVDNAVVMTENVTVLLEEGNTQLEACLESSKTLAIPLLVSSVSTIIAFSPIVLNKENMGEFVGPLSLVVLFALIGSWVINQTLIPLLCLDFLKVKKDSKQDFNKKPYTTYRKILLSLLRNKNKSILMAFGSFVLGIWILSFLSGNFMPQSTDPIMSTFIRLPKGTDINYTKSVVEELDVFIKENYATGEQTPLPPSLWNYITTGGTDKKYKKDGVLSWGSNIGRGAPKYATGYTPETNLPEYAYIMYNLTDYKLIPKISKEINVYLENKYPNIDVVSKGLGSGVSLEKDLGYVLYSDNIKLLKQAKNELKTKFKNTIGTDSISDNWGKNVPNIYIDIDQVKIKQAELTNDEVANIIQFVSQGYTVTSFKNFNGAPLNTNIPIILKGSMDYKNSLNKLKSIEIINSKGRSVSLDSIANISVKYEPSFVYTRDLAYGIKVESSLKPGYTATDLNKEIKPWLDNKIKEWGSEIKYELGGTLKGSRDNKKALFGKVPLALFVMTFLVIAQFNSIRKGLCVMLVIPLSMLGVALGLLLTNTDLEFMALVGIISLAGVVLNHSIILVDKITIEENSGKGAQDSIVVGCETRLRPIFLTVATTIVGFLPLYYFGGPLFHPLAVVLIFGLLTDTVLALGIIPVIYALFFKVDFSDY